MAPLRFRTFLQSSVQTNIYQHSTFTKLANAGVFTCLLCVILYLQIRIWARKNAISAGHGNYALEVTGPVLKFFEKYYDIPYPLSKSGEHVLFFLSLLQIEYGCRFSFIHMKAMTCATINWKATQLLLGD